jgi:quinoprotein glucose dehydrogenase
VQTACLGLYLRLDLKTNQIVWKKRIGTPQDSMPFPMPVPVPFNMGMPMLGGPISTAGNVLFIAQPQITTCARTT